MCVYVCVFVCVFTPIQRKGLICLGLEFQRRDQRCCVEDVSFLCQVPSSFRAFHTSHFILFTH